MGARSVLCLSALCSIILLICCAPYVNAQQSPQPIQPPGDSLEKPGPSPEEIENAKSARNKLIRIAWFVFPVALAIAIFFAIVGRAVAQPATVSVATFAAPGDMVEDVSKYIRNTTNKLVWMGFDHMLDFTIPELPHKGFYRLLSDGTGDHTVLLFEVTPAGSGVAGALARVKFIEFQTLLDNGCRINTNNSPLRNPLIPPPTYLVTSHKRTSDPKELFDIHLKNVERMQMELGGSIRRQRLEDFEKELSEEWQELMQYQVQAGLMKPKRDGRSYHGTAKLILNYFVPGLVKNPPMKKENKPIDPGSFS